MMQTCSQEMVYQGATGNETTWLMPRTMMEKKSPDASNSALITD